MYIIFDVFKSCRKFDAITINCGFHFRMKCPANCAVKGAYCLAIGICLANENTVTTF